MHPKTKPGDLIRAKPQGQKTYVYVTKLGAPSFLRHMNAKEIGMVVETLTTRIGTGMVKFLYDDGICLGQAADFETLPRDYGRHVWEES